MEKQNNNSIFSFLKEIRISVPQTYKNLTIVPFSYQNGNKVKYISLAKAMKTDGFFIKEIDEGASVSDIKVINDTDYNVLIIDGEQFVGAKQNRIINATAFVRRKSKLIINVSCVEEGRWHNVSELFKPSDNILDHRTRLDKMYAVNRNLEVRHGYHADQGEVWDRVHNLISNHDAYSETSALEDVYIRKENELKKFLDKFELLEEQNGIFVFMNNKIAGIEYISNPDIFEEYFPKIIKSYAIHAIMNKARTKECDFIKSTQEFVDGFKECDVKKYKSIGAGYDHRYQNNKIVGSALFVDEEIVHLVGFSSDTSSPKSQGNWMRLDDYPDM